MGSEDAALGRQPEKEQFLNPPFSVLLLIFARTGGFYARQMPIKALFKPPAFSRRWHTDEI